MTKEEIIDLANKASKEWLKEFPTHLETANQVPERYLEIFAKMVVAKERDACTAHAMTSAEKAIDVAINTAFGFAGIIFILSVIITFVWKHTP